jgi:hypothetical protein
MKPWLLTTLVGLGCFVGGGVAYKYMMPPKVTERIVTVTKEIEVVKWQDRLVEVQGPVRTTTRTVTTPGPVGPTVVVEQIVEKEKVVIRTVHDGSSASSTDTYVDKSKITDNRPWVAVEGMLGLGGEGRIAYSAGAQMRVLGPIWLGAGFIKADTWYVGPSARIEF